MANIVDELVVVLGLDASSFNKSQKEALEQFKQTRDASGKTAVEMEARGKQAAQFFSQVKTEALSLMGVLLGGKGLESFVRDATNSMANLGREARNIGMATPELAAFRNMIERNGGSADAAQASFRGLTDEMEKFKITGQSGIIQYLNVIGANRGDSAMAVYRKFAEYAQAHDAQQDNFIGKGLGFDQGSINEAMKGIAQVNRDMAESYKLGVPTESMSEHMQQLQHDWFAMRQAADNLGNVLLDKMQPAMSRLLDLTTDFIIKNPKAAETVVEITTALLALSAIRISSSLLGLTGMAGALTNIVGLTSTLLLRLGMIAFAIGAVYEGFHISGLNAGEQDEIDRENAAHGESHPEGSPTSPTVDPFKYWVRRHIAEMPDGPMKRYLQGKFGSYEVADTAMDEFKRAFLQTLSGPESGGAYNVKNGGSTFDDFSRFPEGIGPGGSSSAAGRYQFTSDTWKEAASALGLTDFSPASQDKAAWWLAAREYGQRTGRDLEGDIKAGGHEADVASALKGRWPSLPGGTQTHQTQADFNSALGQNLANARKAPSPAAGGAPPPISAGVTIDPALSNLFSSPTQAAQTANNTTNVNVGSVVVHTQATDAKGIAASIGGALNSNLRQQADRGLN